MAVDGELVGGGQGAALAADFGQLLLVGEEALGLAPAGPTATQQRPVGAVAVQNRIGRIDEAVPQVVKSFQKSLHEIGPCVWGKWLVVGCQLSVRSG
ncbi:MAG: hypothetical protein NTW96_16940 [Planctomycetia bacterium]|nr:hypothetical protein [Planctomycetia bacterium]